MTILFNIVAALTINITGVTDISVCEVQPATMNSVFMDENGGAYCKDLFNRSPLFNYDYIVVNQRDSIKPIQAGHILQVSTNTKDAARSIETIKTTSKSRVR